MDTELIRNGLHRITGMTCSIRQWRPGEVGRPTGELCGGELRIEKCGSGEFRWETFCTKCKTSDLDGWPTLAECVKNAPAYFGPCDLQRHALKR